ncbi:uncharacterized protein LOC115783270 [Archocentrus centrarchus]|uniref:uncharacterized protein LOC115783270 n=1 Tax=Archocentrus centrarchus TaxID=63155 RepID=UPI0011E9DF63|nr:uncharacterized protein LOC115783270 [Archocentrus centrarchus]
MLKKLLNYLRSDKAGPTGAVIVMLGIVSYMKLYFLSCNVQTFECNEIMAVPFFLVFFLMLLIDQTFRSAAKNAGTLLCLVVKRVFRAISIGLLWVVAMLILTNWYVCCNTDEETRMLFRKDRLKPEEEARKTEVIIKSKLIAYSLLLGMTVVTFFVNWSGWRKYFINKFSCCNKKTFYYKLILEEEKKVLEELLRKEANETLTKEIQSNINRKDWDGCFNVAQQMINKAKEQKPTATNEDFKWISEGSATGGEQDHGAAHQQAQNYELHAVPQEFKENVPLFGQSA